MPYGMLDPFLSECTIEAPRKGRLTGKESLGEPQAEPSPGNWDTRSGAKVGRCVYLSVVVQQELYSRAVRGIRPGEPSPPEHCLALPL